MSSDLQASHKPADAVAASWVDRAPTRVRPYLRLMRLDRPIGTWLLFWPCVFGLAVGAPAQGHAFGSQYDLQLLVLFALGAVVMRGAGCTYNDIVDRDIDAKVARTRNRPIPSGAVSVKAAVAFLVAQCLVGLVVLLQLNVFAIALGAGSLVLVGIYPFMKRVTWWPQAWLGLTFNWGALLGFAALTGRLAPEAFSLYLAGIFWTLGYDTIYALQDLEDDALAGVKSTARLFGQRSPFWIAIFYTACIALLGVTIIMENSSRDWWAVLLLLPALLHLIFQVRRLDVHSARSCLWLFRANRETGALISLALIAASYIADWG